MHTDFCQILHSLYVNVVKALDFLKRLTTYILVAITSVVVVVVVYILHLVPVLSTIKK